MPVMAQSWITAEWSERQVLQDSMNGPHAGHSLTCGPEFLCKYAEQSFDDIGIASFTESVIVCWAHLEQPLYKVVRMKVTSI